MVLQIPSKTNKLLNICPSQSTKFSSTNVNESWLPDKYVNGEMTEMFYYDLQKASAALSTHEFRKRIRDLRDANAKGCVDKNELEACIKTLEKQEEVWNFVLENYNPKLPTKEADTFPPRQINDSIISKVKEQKSKLQEPCKYAKENLIKIKNDIESKSEAKAENGTCLACGNYRQDENEKSWEYRNSTSAGHPQVETEIIQGNRVTINTEYPQVENKINQGYRITTRPGSLQMKTKISQGNRITINTEYPQFENNVSQGYRITTNTGYPQFETSTFYPQFENKTSQGYRTTTTAFYPQIVDCKGLGNESSVRVHHPRVDNKVFMRDRRANSVRISRVEENVSQRSRRVASVRRPWGLNEGCQEYGSPSNPRSSQVTLEIVLAFLIND
ncbi:hypothetical protein Aperf_G00000081416 [Anoplocephala perfoliata]